MSTQRNPLYSAEQVAGDEFLPDWADEDQTFRLNEDLNQYRCEYEKDQRIRW